MLDTALMAEVGTPLFAPPLASQPPLVCTPMTAPVLSRTPEPDDPPCVSTSP